ncbi:MAG: lipid II flippase MurJ [Patescibacteria group bacterium]|mgnify:CR=1 FL=1
MVFRILAFLGKEWHSLNEAALLLSVSALASQVLAVLRDRLLTHSFGASSSLDVYYAAFRIPDFLYVSLASFVSVTALIPFLIEKMGNSRDVNDEARKFMGDVFTLFSAAMAISSAVAFFLIPYLSSVVAPGFSAIERADFISLSRILLLSPFLLGISNLAGSVTQTFRKFFVYALSPVLYNVGIIIGIVFFYPILGLQGIAWGVILGALLHFAIQIPTLAAHRFLPSVSLNIDFQAIKRMVLVSLPRTVALSLNQLSLVAIIAIASLLEEGSVSVFNFSYNLQSVPLAIIGVSYSVAAFPSLVRYFSGGEHSQFISQIESAARAIIFWSLPITFLFIVLRAQIVRTLLGSGQFSWADTRLTAAMLAIFSVSLIAQNLLPLLIRGYYAAGNAARPLLAGVISYGSTIIAAFGFVALMRDVPEVRYFFESLLRVEGVPGTEALALPLAYSLGSMLYATFLVFFLRRDFRQGFSVSLSRTFFESFSASFFMGFTAYQFLGVFDHIFDINTFWGIFLQGFLSGILGIMVGIVILILLKNREFMELRATLHKKFWLARAIAPEQGEL